MNNLQQYTTAIVRYIPSSYNQCNLMNIPREFIDADLAIKQHEDYCSVLVNLGLNLIKIPADNKLPDCTFVEDSAIVFDDKAIICNIGTESRDGEIHAVKDILQKHKKIFEISHPGIIEGGDVLVIDKNVYIGLSNCTNEAGIKQLKNIISLFGYQVHTVRVNNVYHLKSACTYLGNGYIIMAKGYFDEMIFSEYNLIVVPEQESYCANCLSVNGRILIPTGYEITKQMLTNSGFEIIELNMSEFRKAEGSLTCLSVLF